MRLSALPGQLEGWIARFRGVATEHLESYLGWFRAPDRTRTDRQNLAPMQALALGLLWRD